MMVFVSILVLVISLLFISPDILAYRIPNSRQRSGLKNADEYSTNAVSVPAISDQSDSGDITRTKISYLSTLLSDHEVYGIWQNAYNNTQDKNVQTQGGYATLRYMEDYQAYEESFDMMLCLYNGIYTNTNYSCITFAEFIPFIPANSLNEKNMTLNFNDILVHSAQGKDNSINGLGNECVVRCSIYFIDRRNDQPFSPQYDLAADRANFAVQFQVQSQSSECSLDIITNTMIPEDTFTQVQSLTYSVLMCIAAFLQCFLCCLVDKKLQKNKGLCQRVDNLFSISQGSVRVINAFDVFIALQCFFQLMNSLLIAFTALPYAVLAVYFQPKVIRTITEAQGNLKERGFRWLSCSNCFWFILSVIIAILSAFLHKPEWMFLFFCFHQVPQILHNFHTQRKYRGNGFVVLLFVLPKVAYMAYVLIYPQNLFRYSPNDGFAVILANILFIQLVLLLVQYHYPMLCVRRKPAYQSFSVSEKNNKGEVCCICLEDHSEQNTPGHDNALLDNKAKGEKTVMVLTPCKHQFHECCLRDWTKLKSVCPYCRYSLPPLPEEDE